jgi:mono/diheme cytochrome c family protein
MLARSLIGAIAVIWLVLFTAGPALRALDALATGSPCSQAFPVPPELAPPKVIPPGEPIAIERTMLAYLSSYQYRDLGWCHDKGVRDTGPYANGLSYGTHPAVRIYYSPEVMAWLRNGRRGVPADGAVIIKEQYGDKPAAFFKHTTDADLKPTDWTIMIRRSSASHDGWFWAEVYVGMFDAPVVQTRYPNAGFGIYCLRCHASAQRAMTFASLANVEGFPGKPLTYSDDDSWRMHVEPTGDRTPAAIDTSAPPVPVPLPVQTFPPEPLDSFVAHVHVPHLFITSDQCESCHGAGSSKPFGPVMWLQSPKKEKNGLNLSEYGEWRWSPMALAGRDPVFYAQLESEMAYLASIHNGGLSNQLRHTVSNLCLSCHGAMGERSFVKAHPGATFTADMVFDTDPTHTAFHDGGLARDGISCALCHHIVPTVTPRGYTQLGYFLSHKINGDFDLGAPDSVYGPFEDNAIATHPMKTALGVTPKHSSYVTSSLFCASCHTINLPVVDHHAASPVAQEHNVEQATYLEWLNSSYQTEYHPTSQARSCQDCHMPAGVVDPERGIDLAHIATKIAFVEDAGYPETTHEAPKSELNVRVRSSGYRRHELLGLNALLLQMFRQFPDTMGVRTRDYMSGSSTDLADAMTHVIEQARESTATVNVRAHVAGGRLIADVEVRNLTGHRFPSGVAFRRAFIDFVVLDESTPGHAHVLYESGRTDAQGRIVGADGRPLPTESFARDAHGREYQPHFDEAFPITRPDQVEIFEELTRDAGGNFTTSFIRRDDEIKDNRLLPLGWSAKGPTPSLPAYFLQATYPKGRAASDPRYRDGKGHAVVAYNIALPPGERAKDLHVEATLYYQSFAPYYLTARTRGSGPASVRLAAIVKNLDVRDTPLRDWKIRIASGSAIP